MARPKKENRLTIKIDSDLLNFFRRYCKDRQDTMSGHIKRHIDSLRRQEEADAHKLHEFTTP